MNPYSEQAPQKKNLFQKLFSLEPSDNAFIAINNLLATKPVLKITKEEIEEILKSHHIDAPSQERKEELFKPLLTHVLLDGVIDERERRQLEHLCNLLDLDTSVVEKLLGELSTQLYKDAFVTAISDGYLSAQEEQELEDLRKTLDLTVEEVDDLEKVLRQEYLQEQLKEALEDQMLSPAEEQKLKQSAQGVKSQSTFTDSTNSRLRKYRRYWQLRYGALSILDTKVKLQEKEECYMILPAQWCEWKTKTTLYNYKGKEAREKTAKNLFWGNYSPELQRMNEEVLDIQDHGDLYLTDQRLLFVGQSTSKSLRITHILDFDIYTNGLQVQKDAGRYPFIKMEKGMDEVPLLLERLLEFD